MSELASAAQAQQTRADYRLYSQRMQRFGESHAEHVIGLLQQLAATLDDRSREEDTKGPAGPMSYARCSILDALLSELPALHGPARWDEACAAFGAAIFGPEIVPDPSEEAIGSRCQTAFMMAQVYLAATAAKHYGAEALLHGAAVAIHRLTEREAGQSGAPAE